MQEVHGSSLGILRSGLTYHETRASQAFVRDLRPSLHVQQTLGFALLIISTTMAVLKDLEANQELHLSEHARNNTENGESTSDSTTGNAKTGVLSRWYRRVLDAGVEENGIRPVPIEERTQTQHSNLFTVFFTCLLCILP